MKKEELTYETPKIITYSEDDLKELLGPASACAPFYDVTVMCGG